MNELARGGFTTKQITDALHGKHGTRKIRFRYDLLDRFENKIRELTNVISGEIDFAAFNEIKRTAKFLVVDDGSINWLSDRIQPFIELQMPRVMESKPMKIRYIRDWTNGNNGPVGQTNSHWAEIKVLDENGVNIALGKPATFTDIDGDLFTAQFPLEITDGITNAESNYSQVNSSTTQPLCAIIDLGGLYNVKEVTVWHYYHDARTYHGTKTEISENGVDWVTVFDSVVRGEYIESSGGKTHNLITKTMKDPVFVSFPLGIFLLSSPTKTDTTGGIRRDVEAYDGTIILRDDRFESNYAIADGTNVKTAVITLLQSAGITKYIIEDTTSTLSVVKEFEIGESKLQAINSLLTQINFTPIRVDVNGNFRSERYVIPGSRATEYTYKDDHLSIIFQGIEEEFDLFNTPNKWVVVRTNAEEPPLKSVYINNNPDNPTSTVSRGRTITEKREIENISSQEELDAYAERIAYEDSRTFGKLVFSTAIMPMHDYHDMLKIEYSPLNINDKYTETGWNFPLQVGGQMKHEVRKVVYI